MRHILKQLNFSEKEIDVYLAALKLGSAPISQLAKSSGVKRPNAYFILEKMKEKGEELFKVFKFMFDSLWRELEGKNLPTSELEQVDEARNIKLK